ncbi:MAG: hypothetical protein QNJ32_11215 [Xenococcaceae cyanobacterium MO_167.B27]|nr:hypothetical protein [Xenococcaceae cyanobacterium MO_167.B27]
MGDGTGLAIATPWSMDKQVQGLRTEPLDKNPNQSSDTISQK